MLKIAPLWMSVMVQTWLRIVFPVLVIPPLVLGKKLKDDFHTDRNMTHTSPPVDSKQISFCCWCRWRWLMICICLISSCPLRLKHDLICFSFTLFRIGRSYSAVVWLLCSCCSLAITATHKLNNSFTSPSSQVTSPSSSFLCRSFLHFWVLFDLLVLFPC